MPAQLKKHPYTVPKFIFGLFALGFDNLVGKIKSYNTYRHAYKENIQKSSDIDRYSRSYAGITFHIVKHDFLMSLQPYTSRQEVLRDVLQLFRGLFYVCAAPIEIILAIASLLSPAQQRQHSKILVLSALPHLMTGLLQMITAPLNIFLRMPLRKIITDMPKKGEEPIRGSYHDVARAGIDIARPRTESMPPPTVIYQMNAADVNNPNLTLSQIIKNEDNNEYTQRATR